MRCRSVPYRLFRYINQLPVYAASVDHLGEPPDVKTPNDRRDGSAAGRVSTMQICESGFFCTAKCAENEVQTPRLSCVVR